MHPILFRIPLPGRPLFLWWALAAVAAISIAYALVELRKGNKQGALFTALFAVAAGVAGYVFRATSFTASGLPIYSYGVMLGLSLVVGWYLTLTLAERDGLPKETMANCYVVTAIVAIAGSRVLYILTNLDEFSSPVDWFAVRRGGLVAYGGFLGGFLGSWWYCSTKKIRLVAWADDVVPSLASGLLITRIGCYLFGCDFGKRLSDDAPGFLKKLGTFPHWVAGTMEAGDGPPAYIRHLEQFRGTPLGDDVIKANASLPVHPTQIYESVVGLGLLVLLLTQRKWLRFRGQQFFTFVFAYGFFRFLLEMLRDDTERGEYGPTMGEHLLIPIALALFAVGFSYGFARAIRNEQLRNASRVASFLPALAAYLMLRPPSFGQTLSIQLSTSQWIGLVTALLAAYFFAKYWEDAKRNPTAALSLGDGAQPPAEPKADAKPAADEDEEDEAADAAEPQRAEPAT
jgi:phosphatidylglycerol:prolipoprotein diacylglycerol transferase